MEGGRVKACTVKEAHRKSGHSTGGKTDDEKTS